MFVRNLLQAGDHVTIIPAGIRITLQYSERGSLECVYVGHKDDKVLHSELLPPILKSGEVPIHLPITKGTSYVYGVLYTNSVYKVEGKFNNTVEANYISEYLQDPSKFHFFAGHMQSFAVGMNAPMAIQRWLKTMNFNILPSYLVPKSLTEDNFSTMLNLETYPFKYPRIEGYIIFRQGKFDFVHTNVRQMVVKSIHKYTSSDGYILADICSHDLGSINTTYADIVNMNIQEGSVILVNDDNKIIDGYNGQSLKTQKYSCKIPCDYCGRLITVPKTSVRFKCEDEHCISNIYPRAERMLSKLNLPAITLDELKTFAENTNNILSMADILDMDKFTDLVITVDAPKLLDAVVPSSIITRFSDWSTFCNKCNNSVESIKYYIQNPDKMMFDLHLEGAVFRRLFDWLQSSDNILDVIGVMEHKCINVVSTGKRFEGAPIFRGKSIYVTGKCAHGSFEDIHAILTSYSALVYDRFNTAVDCVLVGDFHENIDGKALQKAKQFGIPIFEESEFFAKYDIDNDLAASGL